MQDKNSQKYQILRLLAVAAAGGEDLDQAVQLALAGAVQYVGLTAAAVYLWDDDNRVTLSMAHAESDRGKKHLAEMEEDLFAKLRQHKQLISAYMSFGGQIPTHSFSLPLRHGDRVFGAVTGLQEGEKTVVAEDEFLEALSALLALSYAAHDKDSSEISSRDLLDKERLAAIIETAVTVNHEVNNPLTAILGNVQLLLLKRDDLDDELKQKLETIEASAMKIKDVTQRLMRLTTPRTVEYPGGTKMVDISEEEKSE
ncbi:MAG: GAF domain-containing protein [Candidatus Zixiibacteriota bacterium]|nr:MAG: GAF domain-containing protein [candidate division Zixibacteria bacterium]